MSCAAHTRLESGLLLLFLDMTLFSTADMSARQKRLSLNVACTCTNSLAEAAAEAIIIYNLVITSCMSSKVTAILIPG